MDEQDTGLVVELMEKKMEEEKKKKVTGLEKSSGKVKVKEEEEEEKVELPGFRFHPTDEELVGFYLRRKVERKPKSLDIIKQIDIYKYDPWDLPKVNTAGDKEWYFFCLRGRKYRNSIRPNRVTGSGFWKATGIDRPIYSSSTSEDCIGLKKSLVYYRGSAGKGAKTDWMMHEFRLPTEGKSNDINPNSIQEAELWTICRIFKRNVTYKRFPQNWKSMSAKESPTDSGSKTCSIESDAGDEYKYVGASNIQGDEKKPVINDAADKNQLYAGQLNPLAQSSPVNLQSGFPNPNVIDLFKDGNWDELGRIMELVADPASLVNGCRYSY